MRQRSSQSGMVSIMVTMLMMIVISLIVLGFAQVSRHEQSEALDRQLSTQAFFAAESGVNDARQVINKALVDNGTITPKTTCATSAGGGTDPYNFDPTIDSTNQVSYTCLLVTTQLTNIIGDVPIDGDPLVVPVEPVTGGVGSIHIIWRSNSSNISDTDIQTKCASAVGTNPVSSAWTCPYGVLRVDLVPTSTISRASFEAGQKTFFLYPKWNTGGSINYASADGASVAMKCTAAASCVFDVNAVGGGTKFAMKLTSLYTGGNVTISARSGGPDLMLQNAQVQVDVTGRAKDVLRRIQVRLPLIDAYGVAGDAITSGSSICKHFQYDGSIFSVPGGFKPQDTNGAGTSRNPMCNAMSVGP